MILLYIILIQIQWIKYISYINNNWYNLNSSGNISIGYIIFCLNLHMLFPSPKPGAYRTESNAVKGINCVTTIILSNLRFLQIQVEQVLVYRLAIKIYS